MTTMQSTFNFETPTHHLERRDDPDTSHEAAASLPVTHLETAVLEAIASFGEAGCISDQVRAKFPDLSYSSVTARFAALIAKRLVIVTGERRRGASGRSQRVMKAAKKDV